MNKEEIIKKTEEYVKKELSGETTGHDYFHIERVRKNAKLIGKKENADMFIVDLAVLLHDLDDWKLNKGNKDMGPKRAKVWLESLGVDKYIIEKICNIIYDLSYIGDSEKERINTKEEMIVQDADRLDALGAIGIGRCFMTSQKLGQEMHNPNKKPRLNINAEEYAKQYTGEYKNTSINHFYEKLLLIKDRMNTKSANKIAQKRHEYMLGFLNEFLSEWEGKS